LFDVVYAIGTAENNDEWLWFLIVLRESLGGLQPVIMSDRKSALLFSVPRVSRIENHTYYVRHARENFLTYAAKVGIHLQASKDLLKEVFNRVVYALTGVEYGLTMDELWKFKPEFAAWVECNDPEPLG